MCLTMIISQNGTAYLLTDNSATSFNHDPNTCNTAEELLEAVNTVMDYGSKLIPLKDGAILAWTSNKPHAIGYIEACVDKRGHVANPEAYTDIPELSGYLLKSNPLEIYGFNDGVLTRTPTPTDSKLVKFQYHTVPYFDDVVLGEFAKHLRGIPPIDVISPRDLRALLEQTLIAIHQRCPLIGQTLWLSRIDDDGVTLL